MRKRKKGRKLGYSGRARKALLRGLVRALVLHGRLETSSARAKELARFVDHLVTTVKKETIAAKRQVLATLGGDEETVTRLFKRLPVFKGRTSGFTRLIPLGTRQGDNSLRVRVEWTDKAEKVPKVPEVSKAPQKADEKIKMKKEKSQSKI